MSSFCENERALHERRILFCEEPQRGIKLLPSGSQDCCAVITPLGPRQLCVNRVLVLEREWPGAFAPGHRRIRVLRSVPRGTAGGKRT